GRDSARSRRKRRRQRRLPDRPPAAGRRAAHRRVERNAFAYDARHTRRRRARQHGTRALTRRTARRPSRAGSRRHGRHADRRQARRRLRGLSLELSRRIRGAHRQQRLDRRRRRFADDRRSRLLLVRRRADSRDAAPHDARHREDRRSREPRVRHDREVRARPRRAVHRETGVIIYRKSPQLRIVRATAPEPPFWQATTIAPYSPRRGAPIAIDYLELTATYISKLEVTVAEQVREDLERTTERQPLRAPVLVDATEFAEQVFRRGDEIAQFCAASADESLMLISTRGVLPESPADTVAIATWPLEFHRLEPLFEAARERRIRWGVAIPVIYPVTTNLDALTQLAELAKKNGASFF